MLKPLEFCINCVNKDTSYLTLYDTETGEAQGPVRLTLDQYNAIADAIWGIVESMPVAAAVVQANQAVVEDAVADEVITPEEAEGEVQGV